MTKPKDDPSLTQERLKAMLSYDPETGEFTWLPKPGSHRGRPAGGAHAAGYIRISIDGRSRSAHRLAWLYMTGSWPNGEIDHINRARGDNSWKNLRVSSRSENGVHQLAYAKNRLNVKGVQLMKNGRYFARIYCRNKAHYIGKFRTLDEAAHAYNKIAVELFGEFAVLNPIGQDKEPQHG